jgi:uncharacterized protein (DUF433 family)
METTNEMQQVKKEIVELRGEVRTLREKIDALQMYAVTEHPHIYTSAMMHRGEPTIRGTAITVRTIVERTRLGDSVAEILAGLPVLTAAQVHDALAYYHDHTVEIENYMRENQEALWRLTNRAST